MRQLTIRILLLMSVVLAASQAAAQTFAEQLDSLCGILGQEKDASVYSHEIAEWQTETQEALRDPENRKSLSKHKFRNAWLVKIEKDTVLAFANTSIQRKELVWFALSQGQTTKFRDPLIPTLQKPGFKAEKEGFILTDSLGAQAFVMPSVRMRHYMEIMGDTQYNEDLKLKVYPEFQKLIKAMMKKKPNATLKWLPRMTELTVPKDGLRILSYAVTFIDFSQIFCCAILKGETEHIFVADTRRNFAQKIQERSQFNERNWYGAVYHEIIPLTANGNTYYTLLGYRGTDGLVKQRVLDVLDLNGKHPKFGAPIFVHIERDARGNEKEVTYSRRVYQYSAEANMMLRFDPNINKIVMDHLSPMKQMFWGQWRYYGPDMSFDAYELTKKKGWLFREDIEVYDTSEPKERAEPVKRIDLPH